MGSAQPSVLKLQLSKGYYLRFDQLSRVLSYVAKRPDVTKHLRQEMADVLGMSPVRVGNLSSLGGALGLIVPITSKATPLGRALSEKDPYFDGMETLWLLHYIVGSDPKYVVWNRLVNRVFPEQERVTKEAARAFFEDLRSQFSEQSIKRHLSKEIRCVFDAYTEQAFSRLGYVVPNDDGSVTMNPTPKVPDLTVLASLYVFRDRFYAGATGLEIPDLCHRQNSPGRVFSLLETDAREILERLHVRRLLTIESSGNLDQIRFASGLEFLSVVEMFYA